LQIDRIDTNGNYCPDNCRFVTVVENNSNRRNNILVVLNNKTLTAAEASRQLGHNSNFISQLIAKNKDLETHGIKLC
jgi:hypothetical protein